jgi:hypothetical protein
MVEALVERCVSCGAEQRSNYCPECGERRITASDRSVAAFLGRAFEEVTDLDSRLFRTLKRLVFSPGYLTRAFAEGRRKPYLGPVQIFLLANLLYFLLQSVSIYTAYNTPLESQLNSQGYSTLLPVKEWVDSAITRTGLDRAGFEAVYNNRSELLARSLVFYMVPVLAVFLSLLMLGCRKPFVDHLVFALHFFAFDLLVMHCAVLMVWPHAVFGIADLVRAVGPEPVWLQTVTQFLLEVGGSLLVTVPWLYFAYRRFYGLGYFRAALTALASLVVLYLTVVSYRVLLLLVTLATV